MRDRFIGTTLGGITKRRIGGAKRNGGRTRTRVIGFGPTSLREMVRAGAGVNDTEN